MIVTIDVSYNPAYAYSAAVVFEDWSSSGPSRVYTARTEIKSHYIAGELFLRELPALKAAFQKVTQNISVIIIDGYVQFSKERPALGWYLFHELKSKIPVIGVAKSKFKSAEKGTAVRRGGSDKLLYVTAIGLPEDKAAETIIAMHGEFRIPTMIKLADLESRDRRGQPLKLSFRKKGDKGTEKR
jgi:deoxyribonuclease V